MCGRIGSSMPRAELLETYHWLRDAPEDDPRYNIAPTDPVIAVGPDRAEVVRWGIEGSKAGLFNLRAETALAKPYYQRLLLTRRVLVPASHFYEWRKIGEQRLPVAVSRADGGFLHLAGVLARWEGQPAATILTTTPNADIADLHQPCPAGWLRLAPASLRVNDVHNQGPELLDPEALPANYQMELIPPA